MRSTGTQSAYGFLWEVDEPLQVVYRQVRLPLQSLDWRGLPAAEQEARLQSLMESERAAGLPLDQAPLMRLALIRTTEETYRLVWTHHHLLLDGWSLPLLLKETFAFYEACRQGQRAQLGAVRPYRDYIAWLRQQDAAAAEAFGGAR